MRDSVEISVEICREGVQLPAYAKEGDAGMDVRAAEPVEIKPRETVLIPTGQTKKRTFPKNAAASGKRTGYNRRRLSR